MRHKKSNCIYVARTFVSPNDTPIYHGHTVLNQRENEFKVATIHGRTNLIHYSKSISLLFGKRKIMINVNQINAESAAPAHEPLLV